MVSQSVTGKVNRFRVFRFAKEFYELNGRVPTGSEMSNVLGLSSAACVDHLNALHGADGMPSFSIGSGRRNNGRMDYAIKSAKLNRSYGRNFDENALPLDILVK